MEIIKTKRLIIFPLNKEDLDYWIYDEKKLNKKYHIKLFKERYEKSFYTIIKYVSENLQNDYLNYPYKTFWFIVRRIDRKVIGAIDFKNWNIEKKSNEIGYDLLPPYRGHGYMTETVKAFCSWGFNHGIESIYADTDLDNIKSQNVLKRCQFKEFDRDTLVHYVITKEK